MKDEMKKNTMKSSKQDDTEGNVSRRTFLKGTAGAIAATSAIGLMGGPSIVNAAVAPKSPESPDTSTRWDTKPGDLYNEKLGYGDEDVTGWNGRLVYGPTVGILQLAANIPMLPGDMGNP
ncbi:MAG: twin-arginine translocation signal domain-containing protein, partial [Desulfobacterales bacterium]|nr:twin-arginine translocation signal domain-containing protein [Desulfobacterales bacterium]